MIRRAVITGCGSFLPEKILTNDDLAKMVDTNDAWIRERTGIKERHIASEGELTSDLAIEAAKKALAVAGRDAADIDLIVVATTTPDLTFPSTAAVVQAKLGAGVGAAFDIQAVCTGFIYALSTAEKFIASGQHQNALVIGAETFSRILDWEDRATCVLFGDGAGAFVLEGRDEKDADGRGVMNSYLRCDGTMVDLLYVDGGVSSTQSTGHVRMQGNRVFREAITRISEAIECVVADAGVHVDDIDWFVPHQANERIIKGVVKKLSLRENQVVSTIAGQGNTSAASIPLAWCAGVDDG
ncbi:MAG: ketoacyl-ACP synthase III, partial [Marinicaulis sp.]|nr:ketoacyl-ACP synthase III [Marinicaulis sp.]